jgi:hypothetical protein
MSDVSQLFLKIKLSKQALQDYLSHTTGSPVELSGLSSWLDHQRLNGIEVYIDDIEEQCSSQLEVMNWLQSYCTEQNTAMQEPYINHYDEISQTWTFALLEFSDNIFEIVTALHVISEIAHYKDIESDDFVMIIPYLNGEGTENPMAVMQINMDNVAFKDFIPQDEALQANRIFEVLAQERAD